MGWSKRTQAIGYTRATCTSVWVSLRIIMRVYTTSSHKQHNNDNDDDDGDECVFFRQMHMAVFKCVYIRSSSSSSSLKSKAISPYALRHNHVVVLFRRNFFGIRLLNMLKSSLVILVLIVVVVAVFFLFCFSVYFILFLITGSVPATN